LFRTCKYRPDYPRNGFETVVEARDWIVGFVRWYNHDYRHSAIRFVTPCQRHTGQDKKILEQRRALYELARSHHPERRHNKVRNWDYIEEVWLNPYKDPVELRKAG
jgi:putative transposase